MTDFGKGTCTVVETRVASYDVTQNPNIKADNDWSPYNFQNIVNNFDQIKETIVLMVKKDNDEGSLTVPEIILNTHITRSWFIALDCLAVGLYDPSVLFASISVECILNHDLRLEKMKETKSYEWIDLNWKNLAGAFYEGLPIKLLMNINEKFERNGIEFVERRNKVAHGDIEGYSKFYPLVFQKNVFQNNTFQMGHSRPPKEHAVDQINKAKNFITEWAKQHPQLRLH